MCIQKSFGKISPKVCSTAPGDIDNPESYQKLKNLLSELDEKRGTRGNRMFYLSVAPNFFPEAIKQLGEKSMLDDPYKHRLVIEKPFGQTWLLPRA